MMFVKINICYNCSYYNLKDCYCEKYLKGKEKAVFLCPDCRFENEEMLETPTDTPTDLIDRQYAIATAITGRTREIDGERWIRTSEVRESLKRCPSAQPDITAEQVKEYCKENGYVVLLSDEYNWLKSLKSKSEEFRWNGGGNY